MALHIKLCFASLINQRARGIQNLFRALAILQWSLLCIDRKYSPASSDLGGKNTNLVRFYVASNHFAILYPYTTTPSPVTPLMIA